MANEKRSWADRSVGTVAQVTVQPNERVTEELVEPGPADGGVEPPLVLKQPLSAE